MEGSDRGREERERARGVKREKENEYGGGEDRAFHWRENFIIPFVITKNILMLFFFFFFLFVFII